MDSSTLLWTVDATRGSVNFGRLIPFAGNTYELVFAGVALEEEYTAYVMDESGLKCLAKSEHNAGEYTIAFNTADLRGEFERNMHEMQTFHVIVRDSKRVVAEGDLSVQWQSLWEDTTTGEVFTMRGPEGKPGQPGRRGIQGLPGKSVYEIAQKNGFTGSEEEFLQSLKGIPGSMVRVQKLDAEGNETGKWHDIYVTLDSSGKLRIVIDKTEKEADADADIYINRVLDVKVSGVKTFLDSPIVPEVADVDDDSGKAVSTSFLRKWWEEAKQVAQSISGIFTFSNRIVVKDDKRTEETFRVDAKEHTVTAGGKFVATGSEDHSGTENHYGKETHSGTLSLTGTIEDRTGGNLKTFTDLSLNNNQANEKTINTIYAADETVVGEDKVFNDAEGFFGRIIGCVKRVVGQMVKTAYIKLGLDSSGNGLITLKAAEINLDAERTKVKTMALGDMATNVATTEFVRLIAQGMYRTGHISRKNIPAKTWTTVTLVDLIPNQRYQYTVSFVSNDGNGYTTIRATGVETVESTTDHWGFNRMEIVSIFVHATAEGVLTIELTTDRGAGSNPCDYKWEIFPIPEEY